MSFQFPQRFRGITVESIPPQRGESAEKFRGKFRASSSAAARRPAPRPLSTPLRESEILIARPKSSPGPDSPAALYLRVCIIIRHKAGTKKPRTVRAWTPGVSTSPISLFTLVCT